MGNTADNQNKTYDFIGRFALLLYSQGIKMSFSALRQVLEDNGIDHYDSGRGMASGISAAYRSWEEIEKDGNILTTCGAISNTFVNKDGDVAW